MQTFEILTSEGLINVSLQKINDETFLLKSDILFDSYFIKDCYDKESDKAFIEIRSYIGNVLIKEFWISLDFENEIITNESLEIVLQWLIDNNNM